MMKGITKTFPGVIANKEIDFEAYSGQVHGLLGENGAGKSTLMKILAGYYKPDKGEIRINGKLVKIRSPADAIKLGIGMVYQHFSLVRKFSVIENLMLGQSPTGGLKEKQLAQELQKLSSFLEFEIDPYVRVSDLSVGQQQMVEILKILVRGSEIIVLDEPTSILSPIEVEGLFSILRRIAARGKTVIFISHKLDEVMSICDRITILRSGTKIGVFHRSEIDSTMHLVKLLFGEDIVQGIQKTASTQRHEIVRVESLVAENDLGAESLKGVDLSIYGGEILGIAGVEGNGQQEMAEVLAGIRPFKKGVIYFEQKKLSNITPRMMYDLGVRYITPDVRGEGIVEELNLAENLILKSYKNPQFTRMSIISWKNAHEICRKLIKDYSVVALGPSSKAYTLSGGNLQKFLIARELSYDPKLIIANQPTHGLDVKTTQYVHGKLLNMASKGVAILLISNDLNEVLSISHRIAVIYGGRIVGIFEGGMADKEAIGRLMVGQKTAG